MRRFVALIVLVALVVGTPLLLVNLGYYRWGTLNIWAPTDFRFLLSLLTVAGWVAWLVFVTSLVLEGIRIATEGRIAIRLPGLSVVQGLAGLLLAMLVASSATAGVAAPLAPPPTVAATVVHSPAPAVTDPVTSENNLAMGANMSDDSTVVHVVADGEDLWTLAERYYGQGTDWRKLVAANLDLLGADPTADLPPGTALAVVNPVVAQAPVRLSAHLPASASDAKREVEQHRVQQGETLWQLAEERLGDPDRYPEIVQMNKGLITDPDHIQVGWTIDVPVGEEAQTPAAKDESPTQATPQAATPTQPAQTPAAAPSGGVRSGATRAPATPTPAPAPAPDARATTPDAAPSAAAPATSAPAAPEQTVRASADGLDTVALRVAVGGLGAVAAGAVLLGVRARRREREADRQLGVTFEEPGAELTRLETALGLTVATPRVALIARGMRVLADAWRAAGQPIPRLRRAIVGADSWLLQFDAAPQVVPAPFALVGEGLVTASWEELDAAPDANAPVAYPGLVTLGQDAIGRPVAVDATGWGVLALDSESPTIAAASLSALTLELAGAPWADELGLRVVTTQPGFVAAAASGQVTTFRDADEGLADLEELTGERQALLTLTDSSYAQVRADPDRADAWQPTIYVFESALEGEALIRLRLALGGEPVGVAALIPVGADLGADEGEARLVLRPGAAGEEPSGLLLPEGLAVSAQTLQSGTREALVELMEAARSTETQSAPWWRDDVPGLMVVPDRPDDEDLPSRAAGESPMETTLASNWAVPARRADQEPTPRLRLFGAIDLEGAAGEAPVKARRRCLEYLGWVLEHQGATASEMTEALFVTDGTRRSNLSRLRAWLGRDAGGLPLLPEAYSGRIEVHGVTSDWAEFCSIVERGVNRMAPEALRDALELVEGAPLADAAPGEWAWAEDLRCRMTEAVRDAALMLARRELDRGRVEDARWACERGLFVATDDEMLSCELMRVEDADGNPEGVASVLRQLREAAERDGVDLRPETVRLAQQLLEGNERGILPTAPR